MNTTKKQIHVVINGLNQFGVDELNEHYKYNFQFGHFGNTSFNVGDKIGFTSKRFKNIKAFYKLGLDNYIGNFHCTQSLVDNNGNEKEHWGPNFSFQLKHFNIKVYEVEVVETFKEISLEN